MSRYCPRCGEALHHDSTRKGEVRKTARRAYEKTEKPPRKPSAANLAYSKAFKEVEGKYKKKGGGWKKDGFKNAGAAARRLVKKRGG